MKDPDALSRRSFLQTVTCGAVLGGSLNRCRSAFAQGSSQPAPLAELGGRWRLSFLDDFANAAHFDRYWVRVTDRGGDHQTVRLPENVAVSDGGLHLKLGHGNDEQRPYTGGFVQSRSFRQCFGYFECEMRIANETGVNNAFWLTSDHATEGDARFELDIAEAKYPNLIQVAARSWRPRRVTWSATSRPGAKLSEDFHCYSMLWTEQEFRFFFDEVPIYSVANTFAHTPAMVLFSNAVASFAGKSDGHVEGSETSIRRVRVFEKVG
ncbi:MULTISPECIES: glycoside hydrolase family 16 protein [Microvirga]|uniref:glycoside hydrolase family 16 protein n=1 Tax=Microvirga TaxID=186650 RepID=UPI001B35FAF6|nr:MULTISPECIES: glycoside hydrolase family 16 protein [unclassified Microvirga]MBQ0820656.1 glycoside hydrolase family 16 protein [Microvirga sp. HBU67558]